MNIAAYKPTHRIRRADPFQLLFNDYSTNASNGGSWQETHISTNVLEGDDHFALEIAVPGFAKEHFEIKVEDDQLKVSFTRPEMKEDKVYRKKGFDYKSFNRVWKLSEAIDQQKIEANYQDGILRIVLWKREEAKKQAPKVIDIL